MTHVVPAVRPDMDIDLFHRSLSQHMQSMVKSMRRMVRLSVSRDEDRVGDNEDQMHDVGGCIVSLLPLLAVMDKLYTTSRYFPVQSLVSDAYDVLRGSLKFLIAVSPAEPMQRQVLEIVSMVVPLCLHFEPFIWETSEQEVSGEEVLEVLKSHIAEMPESPAQQVIDLLLDSCLTHRRSCARYTGLTPPATPDSRLSDVSLELGFECDGYEADDELRIADVGDEAAQILKHLDLIRLPRLAFTLIELLAGDYLSLTQATRDSVLFRVLERLVTWCQEREGNAAALQESGFTSLMIRIVRELTAPSSSPSDRIIRKAMSLFTIVARHGLEANDLRSYLSLFKAGPQPPFQILLTSLNDVCGQYDRRSAYVWITPNIRTPVASAGVSLNSQRKGLREESGMSCVSADGLFSIPLAGDVFSDKCVSISFWMRLSTCCSARTGKNSGPSNSRSRSTHLLSLSFEDCSLEVRLCLKKRQLKYRIIRSLDPKPLSEADENHCKARNLPLIPESQWTHICLSILLEACVKVRVCVNGDLRSLTSISNPCHLSLAKNKTVLQMASSDSQYASMDISCVKVFAMELQDVDMSLLYLMGPNGALLSLCHESHVLPEFPDEKTLLTVSLIRCFMIQKDRLPLLRHNVRAEFPLFNRSPGLTCLFFNERPSTVTPHKIYTRTHSTSIASNPFTVSDLMHFPIALNDAGGVTTQLFLFATLVEGTSDGELQAQALDLLFGVIDLHPELQRDFILVKGYDMVNQVILSDICIPCLSLFQVYLRHCILIHGLQSFLRSCESLKGLFRLWKKWHQVPEAASLVYNSILCLVQRDNPFSLFNIQRLRQMRILKQMTSILETCSLENSDLLSLNGRDVLSVCQIFRLVIGSPPELPFITDLVQCLILLHDSTKAYVCQSKRNVFFLPFDGKEELSSFANNSLASAEEWQFINRTAVHTNHESRHDIVFAELMNTLCDVITDLLPHDVHRVLGRIVTAEHFLIWINNENGIIRESVLKTLLTSLKKPQSGTFVSDFMKKEGFHLLSNQLTQYSVSSDSLSSLITFILDADRVDLCFEDWTFTRNWYKVTPIQASAFQAFMSLLLKSHENVSLAHWSLQNLNKLLKSIPNSSHVLKYLHDNGLIICLTHILCKNDPTRSKSDLLLDDDVIERDIMSIVETLSYKLITSSGNIFKEAFDDVIDFFIMRSLSCGSRNEILRLCSIATLRTAFDTIHKYASDPKFATQSSFKVDGVSRDVIDDQDACDRDRSEGHISLSREVMEFRLRHIIERSIDVVSLRQMGSACPDTEKFFVRTLLHTLFLNSVGQDSSRRWLVNPLRKFLRSKLSVLLVMALSPLFSVADRVQFALWIAQSLPVDLSCCLNQKQLHFVQSLSPSVSSHCSPNEREIVERCLSSVGPDRMVNVSEWLEGLTKKNESTISKITARHVAYFKPFEALAEHLVEHSMSVTQSFVHCQNQERVQYFARIKKQGRRTYAAQKKWRQLVRSVIHEAHFFHDVHAFPKNWQLDPSEGPSRMRRKLMRCHLDIERKYFNETATHAPVHEYREPLASVCAPGDQHSEVSLLIDSIHANEQILLTYCCTLVMPQFEYTGELLLSDTCAHFIGRAADALHCQPSSVPRQETWILSDIREFLERRYQLQDIGLELFLENGNSYLLALTSSSDAKNVANFFSERGISLTTEMKSLTGVTRMWREGTITNFDYLMFLNKLAGRSFNDLMIYPVYPFVLRDYKSDVLDLSSGDSFRDLSKPMAVQKKSREKYYREQYQYLLSEYNRRLENEDATLDPVSCPVYHYGSHYSNSGTVLHFLVRLPPFTQMFLQYQDRSFDIPDRTFHSMNVTWNLSSGDSTTDFKEMIPEFFYLPEFLTNLEHFDFGKRHNGIRVDDVNLPVWCRSDPRLFVLINRQALESDYVSKHLNHWIDLIFGFKQSGKHAIEAINVFHPATYYGLEVNKIEDSLKRNALITMIRTFGQMPKQLFKHPHPHRMPENSNNRDSRTQVLGEVIGLKWGRFVGSPADAEPIVVFSSSGSSFRGSLTPLQTSDIFGLPPNSCLLVSYNIVNHKKQSPAYINSLAIVSWNHADGMIRVRDRRGRTSVPFVWKALDSVSMCASLSSYGLLFVAFVSGAIAVFSMPTPFDRISDRSEPLTPTTWLFAHTSPVSAMLLNREFRVSVTCDESGVCFLWDLNSLSYVRTLCKHESAVTLVCISPTLGDIATVSDTNETNSRLMVCTVNGQLIGSLETGKRVTAVCYSSCPEGVSVNVLVTAFSDGCLQMWSSWDLTPVRVLSDNLFSKPITSVCFFLDNNYLCAMNSEGGLRIWGKNGNPVVTTNPVTIL